MLAGDAAAQQAGCIVLHTADGHVGCGLSLLDVKPNGNVLQPGALQAVNGARSPAHSPSRDARQAGGPSW